MDFLQGSLELIINKDTSFSKETGSRDVYGLGLIKQKDLLIEAKPKEGSEDDYGIGFYTTNRTTKTFRVQLWPEHLPYDEFKRKKAFLFC